MTALAQAVIRPLWIPFLRAPRPVKLWLTLFGIWALFISGVGSTMTGSPGLTQVLRLKSILSERESRAWVLKGEIGQLQLEALELEKNRYAQQREIRHVLGYAAPDEIVFDF